MMDAAEALLIERGSDDFALTDVSRVGRVSIGSIYNRFSGKDELIRAVHARVMERIEDDHTRIVMRARSRSTTPVALVHALIDELAEFLAAHAHIMRPVMLRAAFDKTVQDRGRVAHDAMSDLITAELLTAKDAITHVDPERAIRATIGIAYAAIARELGFGMTEAPYGGPQWDDLKAAMGEMAARYLLGTVQPG